MVIRKGLYLSLVGMVLTMPVFAQQEDSKKENGDRGVMLNAETADAPREISIGLPTDDSASICEDGLKHGYTFIKGRTHWAGGNAYSTVGLRGLSECIIKTGDIGIVVDSHTKLGGDKLEGAVTAKTSSFGLINLDAAISGPIKKGWYYSVGAYINLNPTSVNAPGRKFVDNKQIIKMAISKRWSNAEINFLYKQSRSKDSMGGYTEAPFYYVGDGSVKALDGYKLGRSCYFPADDHISYLDLMDGSVKTGNIGKMDERYIHDVVVKGKYLTNTNWELNGIIRGTISPNNDWVQTTISGIDDSVGGMVGLKTVTLPDGTPYSGLIQNRIVKVIDTKAYDLAGLFEVKKAWERHKLNLGYELIWVDQYERTSTTRMAHTVEADPKRVYFDGQETWGHNRNAQYVDGMRVSNVLFAFHEWDVTKRLFLKTGLRFRMLYQSLNGAYNLNGATNNSRTEGFYINNGVVTENNITLAKPDGAVTLYGTYKILDGFYFIGEGFYSLTNKAMSYFKTASIPSLKAIGNALGRGGFMYKNKWLDVTGLVSYITCWNCAATVSVTEVINGQSETLDHTAQYGMGNLGFNFDGNMHWGGFNLHLMCTVQDPKYKNYDNTFVFSDGSTKTISYNGNYATGISRVELEIDPSYKYKDWRFWLSARYFSRQYASRTNLAYFDGRWETFGGIDWNILKGLKVSVNVVNWLFQTGPKGSIDAVDTISDPSALEGILMSGKYMRPFEVNLGISYRF